MTQINAKIVADSKNEFGNRLTTMLVTFPRYILAELNTHRMLSKNSASSRAIPFEKMVKSVEENPFIPIAWQKDHKGMQGSEYLTGNFEIEEAKATWLIARDRAIHEAKNLNRIGVTKQLCNRLLEPFMWHTVLISGTEWENFFALRCPEYVFVDTDDVGNPKDKHIFRSKKDYQDKNGKKGYDLFDWFKLNQGQADIHMMALAEAMWNAYNESKPKDLKAGEWHIPFGDDINMGAIDQAMFGTKYNCNTLTDIEIKIATARCARISYTVVGEEGKEPNYENDINLYDRLAASGHWSPFEHCARAMSIEEYELSVNGKLKWTGGQYDKPLPVEGSEGWSGNFRGFVQYRKMFANENIS
jgi:hypothetical protein